MKKIFGLNLYLVILAGIMLTIVVIIGLMSNRSRDTKDTLPAPTPLAPAPFPPNTNPPIQYEPTSTQKMLDILSSPINLSQSDTSAKKQILSYLPEGQASGIVYVSPTVKIDYTSAADQIQVEILTIDINRAKLDATIWLTSNGLSQNGICDLPVIFYLNRSIARDLENLEIIFDPLAEGC